MDENKIKINLISKAKNIYSNIKENFNNKKTIIIKLISFLSELLLIHNTKKVGT